MKKLIFIHSVFLLLLAGCGKDAPVIVPPNADPCLSSEAQELKAQVDFKFGNQDFSYGTVYTLADGMKVRFSCAQFYLSKFSLENETTTTPQTSSNEVLAKPDAATSSLGKIPAGNYDTLNVAFGLDSTTNYGDPSTYPTGHPLSISFPSMHWSWSQGYLFVRIEGTYDPLEITDEHPGSNFDFHVGEFPSHQITFVKIPLTKIISACETNTIKLKIDLEKIFTAINLETENNTATVTNKVLEAKIWVNLISGVGSGE